MGTDPVLQDELIHNRGDWVAEAHAIEDLKAEVAPSVVGDAVRDALADDAIVGNLILAYVSGNRAAHTLGVNLFLGSVTEHVTSAVDRAAYARFLKLKAEHESRATDAAIDALESRYD